MSDIYFYQCSKCKQELYISFGHYNFFHEYDYKKHHLYKKKIWDWEKQNKKTFEQNKKDFIKNHKCSQFNRIKNILNEVRNKILYFIDKKIHWRKERKMKEFTDNIMKKVERELKKR